MALPPKGDPRRPLHLAIRSTRLLGVVLLLFCTCTFAPYLISWQQGSRRGAASLPAAWSLVGIAVFYFIPGALFMVLSVFLGRRRHWAVVCALVLSCLVGAFTLLTLGMSVIMLVSSARNRGLANPRYVILVPVVLIGLFGAAVWQLIYHLTKSFEAIKYPPLEQELRGFEPLPVLPVAPAPGADPPSASGA
jgi:hypothetical protein